ncbi:MAG: acylphosphatase [Candidatus Hydrothermarchaeaceae archaeon]
MIRAEIIVKGRVQKAGYRDFVDEKAFKYNLKGSIENLEDKTVKIECEGPKENIERFANDIQVKKYPIHVEDIEVTYYPDVKGFSDFEIIRETGEAAIYERLDTAAYYLREMNSDLGEKVDGVGDKIDVLDKNLGDKIDGVGDKVDGVGDKIDVLDKNLGDKVEGVGDKVDTLDENLGGKIDKFSMATAGHFNSLDSKYHIVSENLMKIAENNKKTSENLDRLVGLVETLVRERSNGK